MECIKALPGRGFKIHFLKVTSITKFGLDDNISKGTAYQSLMNWNLFYSKTKQHISIPIIHKLGSRDQPIELSGKTSLDFKLKFERNLSFSNPELK